MPRPLPRALFAVSVASLLSACGADGGLEPHGWLEVHDDSDHEHPVDVVAGWGRKESSLAVSGRWQLPPDVVAAGNAQVVTFNNAPPWDGGGNCSSGATAGALTMRDALLGFFPQVYQIGIYNCRVIAGTNSMSLHGVGRALDMMIQTTGGQADNGAGDPIANWLVANAQALGVQTVIWDRTIWRVTSSPRQREYTGSNPHIDHLHVEINVNAANENPAWYDAPWGPVACEPLAPEATVIDEGHSCFALFGPAQYWRHETGAGAGGDLYWTNAFEGAAPSNWARWALPLSEAGQYRVEVNVAAAFGMFEATRYTVRAGGVSFPVVIDQSAASGWTELGVFSFAAGGAEHVVVEDNALAPVADGQHIVADALRITPVAVAGCAPLPAEGGVVDETSPCFDLHGPAQYWRAEAGAGHEGALLWTNAFESDQPSNWAEWRVPVSETGVFAIEVYVDPAFGQFSSTRYRVSTGGEEADLVVDQGAASGWAALGDFPIAAGADARVSVFDNHAGPVGAEKRIVVDALRLLRRAEEAEQGPPAAEPPVEEPPVEAPPVEEPPEEEPPVDDPPGGEPADEPEPPTARDDDPRAVVDADEVPDDAERVGMLSIPPSVGEGDGCSASTGGGQVLFAWLALGLALAGGARRRGGRSSTS